MGRPVFYRQRIKNQASSVQAKSLLSHLANEIKARREISSDEAWLIALDAERFLEQHLLELGHGQIELPCIKGINSHFRQSREDQPEKLVKLTVVADEDASLTEEFGTVVMQQGRLARIIEEAYDHEALLDGRRLCLLMPLTLAAIRNRLNNFWQQEVRMPIAGMTKKSRDRMKKQRAVLAIELYLKGEDLVKVRRDLAISKVRWQHWWKSFQTITSMDHKTPETLSEITGFPTNWVEGWLQLWELYKNEPLCQERVGGKITVEVSSPPVDEEDRLWKHLTGEHGYTKASADYFMQELRDLAIRLKRINRRPGQIITFGVAADEPPGRSMDEVRLELVTLDYVIAEDWENIKYTSPQKIKWERLRRLATQAYEQGVALSLADLAHLLGISTDAIQNTMKKHEKVLLPTRGRVADMGSTLSHTEKIIALYMDGYTETEVKRRTGHSIESIERYLFDFSRIICLLERGMPLPAIRQATGMSRKVVTKYIELYERFNHPDFAFRMARVRRMVTAENLKKKRR